MRQQNNSNGYCNVDFVFTLDPTNTSCICGIKVIFSIANIVPINETSEQNSNGYCNVDFVFMLDPTNGSCICGIKVIFSIINLYLFLKVYLPTSVLLTRCGLTCVVSLIFCAITCTVTEVAIGIVNASNKELQVCVW